MVCAVLNASSELCSVDRRACSTMPKLSSQTSEGVNAEWRPHHVAADTPRCRIFFHTAVALLGDGVVR
jgi:hypothetical protein